METLDEFFAIEEIQRDAWGFADKEIVPQSILVAIRNAGGLVLGGFLPDGEMGGFAFSFLAGKERDLHHHSHMAAVKGRLRGSGLALAVKRAQRRRVLDLDLDRITWTYDPLEARNGAFNVRKLGAVAHRYIEDIYGLSSGFIHGGLPTDRVGVTWDLKSPEAIRLAQGRPPATLPPPEEAGRANRTEADGVGPRRPVAWQWDGLGPEVLVEIPRDIQALKGEARGTARSWRLHIREGLPRLFDEGYRIRGFHYDEGEGRPFYLLCRDDPLEVEVVRR